MVGSCGNTGGKDDFGVFSNIIQIDEHVMRAVTHGGMFVGIEVCFVEAESKPECVCVEGQESSGCVCYHILLIFFISNFCNYFDLDWFGFCFDL